MRDGLWYFEDDDDLGGDDGDGGDDTDGDDGGDDTDGDDGGDDVWEVEPEGEWGARGWGVFRIDLGGCPFGCLCCL